jgi:signal peptidase I
LVSTPRLFHAFVALAVGIVIWSSVGPASLGGPLTVAVTRGISMEPMFSQGDMVFVRRASEVRSGDVILYRSSDTGQRILHRVTSTSGSGFITKGDNNARIDTDEPTMDDIDGVYWFHVSGAGELAARLRSPMATAGCAGVLVALVAMSLTPVDRVRRSPIQNSRK